MKTDIHKSYILFLLIRKLRLSLLYLTGKTMVARILGKLLHMVGILPTDKVTEVQRTDLVGEFVGHTGPKTRRKVQALCFIIFVSNIYLQVEMTNLLMRF